MEVNISIKQEPRDENFEVKIKTESSLENCYIPETYVNDCDSFKVKQEALKIEEEFLDSNLQLNNSSSRINIKHEERFEVCEEIKTEIQDKDLYAGFISSDETSVSYKLSDYTDEEEKVEVQIDMSLINTMIYESDHKKTIQKASRGALAAKRYRERNREAISKRRKENRLKFSDVKVAAQREYERKYRERHKEALAKKRKENRLRETERNRRYREQHREEINQKRQERIRKKREEKANRESKNQ